MTWQTTPNLLHSYAPTSRVQALEKTEVVGRQNIFLWIYSGTYVSDQVNMNARNGPGHMTLCQRYKFAESPVIHSIISTFCPIMYRFLRWRVLQHYNSVVAYLGEILQCYFFRIHVYVKIFHNNQNSQQPAMAYQSWNYLQLKGTSD